MNHRNINLRLTQNLKATKSEQANAESEKEVKFEINIQNKLIEASEIENALSNTRNEMKDEIKGRNLSNHKINKLKKRIKFLKEDIQLIETEGLNNIVITEIDKDNKERNKRNLFEPFEPQSALKGSIIIIDSTEANDDENDDDDEDDNDNKKKHTYSFHLNTSNSIPKLNLNQITNQNSTKCKKSPLIKESSKSENKLLHDIQVLKTENTKYAKIIDDFKEWFKNIPLDIVSKMIYTSDQYNSASFL